MKSGNVTRQLPGPRHAVLSIGALTLGLIGILTDFSPLVVLGLVASAMFALDPRFSSLTLWPVGLAAVLTLSLVLRALLWIGGVERYNKTTSVMFLATLFLFLTLLNFLMRRRKRTLTVDLSRLEGISVSVIPAAILAYATIRFALDPETLISSYIGGGDHANHISYVQMHLEGTPNLGSLPPWAITGYPQGIHIFLAVLVASSEASSDWNPLVLQYSTASWFEWVQLSSFVSLAGVVALGLRRGRSPFSVTNVLLALLALMMVPQLLNHLFWSGFTTSLAISWILLLPIAFVGVVKPQGQTLFLGRHLAWLFVFVAFLATATYQIYVLPLLVMAVLVRIYSRNGRRFAALISDGVALLVTFGLPYLVLTRTDFGRGFSSQILEDGALWKPSIPLTIAIVASIATVHVVRMVAAKWRGQGESRKSEVVFMYFFVMLALTVSVWRFTWAQDSTYIRSPPYYIDKMLWIVVVIGIPLLVSQLTDLADVVFDRLHIRRASEALLLLVTLGLVFGTTSWQSSLKGLTRPYEVRWFSSPLMTTEVSVLARSAAFSQLDPLGAHVANLTVRNAGSVAVPVPVGLSANPIRFCQSVNSNSIETVYLFEDARKLLFEAGCSDELNYVVDGEVLKAIQREYAVLPAARNRSLAIGKLGNKYVQRGFLASEPWGRWATGYQSLLAFEMPTSVSSATLTIKYRVATSTPASGQGVLRIDGNFVEQIDLDDKSPGQFQIDLGRRSESDLVKVTIACSWTESESEVISDLGSAPPCIGIEEFRLETNQSF